MSFPRYPKYKDSGVSWLGPIPEHWVVCALRRLVRMQSGESITAESIDEVGNYPVFGGNGIRGYTSGFTHDGKYALIGRQGALCGNINYASGKFWASEHAVVVSPSQPLDVVWLGETLRAMNLNQYSVAAAQPGLSVELVGRLRLPVPPLTEQLAISEFLQRETTKIDELVAEQRRLMELLKKKRQAVISHAVTKGLNPDAPKKPSGVEWLGDVPAHWMRRRLRFLFRQEKRQNQPPKPVLSVYRDYGVILKDSRDDNMNKTPEDLSAYQLVNPQDLVVNKMKAWQGSLGISEFEGITSPDYVVFTPRHDESPRFLHLLLRCKRMVTAYRGISSGIRPAQWRLEPDAFLDLPAFLPPLDEQSNLIKFVEAETACFEELACEAERTIDLLQERRTALISAAVTGQIDVRAIAERRAA